ncbi:hypothetical protein [Jiella pelagia]|uniref:Uncharacterized protein n=1 Tax=Jiella pelagia TaxID=2986949 RepID=A0ABY7BV24_9HYPH|nr:hypothetical protein [Jiella pelagia]WAP67226.1 hypothetical protein OH818_16755 [Jiella pelagia]
MASVTFSRAFDYKVPGKTAVVAYRAGWSGKVPAAHAEAARAAGALERPAKAAKNGADNGGSGPAE